MATPAVETNIPTNPPIPTNPGGKVEVSMVKLTKPNVATVDMKLVAVAKISLLCQALGPPCSWQQQLYLKQPLVLV